MKKAVSLLLALTLCLALAAPTLAADTKVMVSPQSLTVDGKSVNCEKYNIDGSNYFKLRDLAALMVGTPAAFGIDFDAENRTVYITCDGEYERLNTDLRTGADNSATCVPSAWKLVVDGQTVEASTYNIGGSNFYKLRDLDDLLGFAVDFDPSTNTAIIYSDAANTAVAPDTPFFEGFHFSAPAEQPTPVTWYIGDSHDAQGGEITTGIPVITRSAPDSQGLVTYRITYTYTGRIEFPTPKDFKDYRDLGASMEGYGAFDYYTGVRYSSRALTNTDRFNYDMLISVRGKTYTVKYTLTLRGNGTGERTYSDLVLREASTEEMEITAPADYDGLMIALRRGGPEYRYMTWKEGHSDSDVSDSKRGPSIWNDYDNLSDWVFIRVSDYAQDE